MPIAVIVASFKALAVLAVLILIIGLIKPKWVLFWMEEPNRILVSGIALIMFMTAFTAYTQFTVQPKQKTERERTQDETNELNLGGAR
jgi:ABC-type Fe3+-siderophore transport system permease subunit